MPKRILLADDSITIQKVVELTFSDGDYEIVSANNGARALQKLAESMPDIILSDIIMPEKNGYEVCEFVKSHPEYRDIPVILLTGTFEPFDPDRAQKAGCDAVVTKPFESQSLINKVEELIQKRRLTEEQSRAVRGEAFVKQPLDSFLTPPPAAAEDSAAEAPPDHSKTMPWQMPTVDQNVEEESEQGTSAPFETEGTPFETTPLDEAAADDSPFDAASGWQPIADDSQPESPLAALPFEDSSAAPQENPLDGNSADAVFDAPTDETGSSEWGEPQPLQQEELGHEESGRAVDGGPFETVASSFDAQPESVSEPEAENLPESSWAAPVDHAWATPAVEDGADQEAAEQGKTLPFPMQDDSSAGWAEPDREDREDDSYSAPTIISPSGVEDGFAAWAPQAPAESSQAWSSPDVSETSEERSFELSPEPDEAHAAEPALELEPETSSAPAEEPAAPAYDPTAIWESAPQEDSESPAPTDPEISVPAVDEPAAEEAAVQPAARSLTDEDVERIARRVVELMTGDVVKNIAWEVVPDVAEMVVRERVRELENE